MNAPQKWSPKWLAEALSAQSTYAPDDKTRREIRHLLLVLAGHRPVGGWDKGEE